MNFFPSVPLALLLAGATLLPLSSCVAPVYGSGKSAEKQGDLVTARERNYQGYLQVRGQPDHRDTAYAVYEYARLSGHGGDTRAADEAFRETFKLIKASSGTADRLVTPARSEYARFLKEQGRYREAAAQFKLADAELQKRQIERIDPVGYAELLEQYRDTLAKTGQASQAAKLGAKAKSLRAGHPARPAHFQPKPYPRTLQPGHRRYGPLNG
jgi:tetratricopeptide (TPR) repeat protein